MSECHTVRPRRSPDNDLSVYDGQHAGTVRRLFTRRFLALETTGNRLGVYPTQVAAMRALPTRQHHQQQKARPPHQRCRAQRVFHMHTPQRRHHPEGGRGILPPPFHQISSRVCRGQQPPPGCRRGRGRSPLRVSFTEKTSHGRGLGLYTDTGSCGGGFG